jgi:cytochrome c oxidase cbb3-type subunit 4
MDTSYQAMRTFADSWGLLYMTIIFVGVVIWAFRPGSGKQSDEAAGIPLREDHDD